LPLLLPPRLDVLPRFAELPELPELPLFPREDPLPLLEPDRPDDELPLLGDACMALDELESLLSESLELLRVEELPMPSSLRLPRSLRPLVPLLLLDPPDEPRSTPAAE
jgi:hypothetical protein